MDYGLKASKANTSVLTETIKNQRFNSNKNVLKIFKSGSTSFTTNGSGDATATVAHNLGYAPGFFVFRKDTANWSLLSGSTDYSNAYFPVGSPNFYVKNDGLHHAIHAYADGTNLYIQAKGGKPSTTIYFQYYLLVDNSESFSGNDGVTTTNDFGFRSSKEGFSATTGKEYQMSFSTKYKILQHFAVNKKTETLTLPIMYASYYDQSVEEGTYVDFNHGLGYAPLFIAHADSPFLGGDTVQLPFTYESGIDAFYYSIAGWADATRVRIYFWRNSVYFSGTIYDSFPAETITIRVYIFTENLAGSAFSAI